MMLHNDNAFENLTIDRATDLNKGIEMQGVRLDDNHAPGTVGMTGAKTAVWYVMPEQSVDHIGFVGSFFNEGILSTRAFYHGLMSNIVSCGG